MLLLPCRCRIARARCFSFYEVRDGSYINGTVNFGNNMKLFARLGSLRVHFGCRAIRKRGKFPRKCVRSAPPTIVPSDRESYCEHSYVKCSNWKNGMQSWNLSAVSSARFAIFSHPIGKFVVTLNIYFKTSIDGIYASCGRRGRLCRLPVRR